MAAPPLSMSLRYKRPILFQFQKEDTFTKQIWKWLDEIDRDVIREHLYRHDFLAVRKLMEPYLFPLLNGRNSSG